MYEFFRKAAAITRPVGRAAKGLAKNALKIFAFAAILTCGAALFASPALATPMSKAAMHGASSLAQQAGPAVKTAQKADEQASMPQRNNYASGKEYSEAQSAYYKQRSAFYKKEKAFHEARTRAEKTPAVKNKKSAAKGRGQALEQRSQEEWVALYRANTGKFAKPKTASKAAHRYKNEGEIGTFVNDYLEANAKNTPYRWGGESFDDALDCSAFALKGIHAAVDYLSKSKNNPYMLQAMKNLNVRSADEIIYTIGNMGGGCYISENDIKNGDLPAMTLIGFKHKGGKISHIGIVVTKKDKNNRLKNVYKDFSRRGTIGPQTVELDEKIESSLQEGYRLVAVDLLDALGTPRLTAANAAGAQKDAKPPQKTAARGGAPKSYVMASMR
ncbi:MAG: NlpC/P60 family protein [Alphaproteobacteria bacterium]|nr:NlpC/P60 family protein [Alphaproteobacteria bacterium]